MAKNSYSNNIIEIYLLFCNKPNNFRKIRSLVLCNNNSNHFLLMNYTSLNNL